MTRGRDWADAAILLSGLTLFAALALDLAWRQSGTFDEPLYIASGYVELVLADQRLLPASPPLVKVLSALPALLLGARMRQVDSRSASEQLVEFSRSFLYRWNDADQLLLPARGLVIAMTLGLLVALFRFTRLHWGAAAARAALFLGALEPNLLAHGSLVTGDLAAALLIFLTVVAFERLSARATWSGLLLTGLALGCALAAKFSSLSLLVVLPCLAAATSSSSPPMLACLSPSRREQEWEIPRNRRLPWAAALLVATGAIAILVLWAWYGFRSNPAPGAARAWDRGGTQASERRLGRASSLVARTKLLPEAYLLSFERMTEVTARRRSFLMGARSDEGFWYYFPITFALKTPLPLVILIAVSLIHPGLRRTQGPAAPFVWIPVVVYTAFALTSRYNIGYRHLLPLLPFLLVAAGRAAAHLWEKAGRVGRATAAALLAWYGMGTLWIHPHELAYFNEIVGGPANGYKYLVDSNLDWGQDLKELKRYVDAHGSPRIKLSYFGTADPSYYGIACDLLPGFEYTAPRPAQVKAGDVVVVSATNLQGVHLDRPTRALMAHLRQLPPVGRVGYSLFVFRADVDWSIP